MKYGIYIDIITQYEKDNLLDESISADEPIKQGDEYPIDDHVEIRTQIKNALKPLASKIKNYNSIIKYAQPDMSPKYIKRGLSTYVDFGIIPPDGLTNQEIDKNYKWSIRFSEHGDLHGEGKNRYYVELEGRKLNDLCAVGWRKFKSKLPKIQKKIRDFEIEKFGEQKTFITDEKPDETVSEKLQIAEAPFQFRRSVGNWNPRTIRYDFDDLIFSTKDAKKAAIFADISDDIMWYINSCRADYDFCRKVNDCDKRKLLDFVTKKGEMSRDNMIKTVKQYIDKYVQ